jgi:hypothetical protein
MSILVTTLLTVYSSKSCTQDGGKCHSVAIHFRLQVYMVQIYVQHSQKHVRDDDQALHSCSLFSL